MYYTEKELDLMDEYTCEIKSKICSKIKWRGSIKLEDITINHVEKINEEKWKFHWSATIDFDEVCGMRKDISFNEWLNIKKRDERHKKLEQLGI